MSGIWKPTVGAQLNLDHPLAYGLVGCWLMNEGSGNRIYDLSGNGNDGTSQNIDFVDGGWRPGRTGPAFLFDGADDYIDCGSNSSLDITGTEITLAAWVKVNVFINWPIIIEKNGFSAGYRLRFRANTGNLNFILDEAAGYSVTANQAISIGNWHHVLARYSGGLGLMELFINGVKDPNTDAKTNAIETAPESVKIGKRGGTYFFNGLIDDVRIWNRALSAEEIGYLYAFPYCMFDEVDIWKYIVGSLGIPLDTYVESLTSKRRFGSLTDNRILSSLTPGRRVVEK